MTMAPTPVRLFNRRWSARLKVACAGMALAASACAASPMPAPPAVGEAVTARVSQGVLRGVGQGAVQTFRNIPYAAPPVGPLRWRPPQPAVSWVGERDADAFGFDCMQNRPFWDDTQSRQPVSEDCLTLNVWTPERRPRDGAPVMVWIHGGGFVMGSASQPLFDGAALSARGVVVVTLNYRLGRFGFFAHPTLSAEHPEELKGNYGLMDQIAALEWVRDNIAALGGDPANVTLFGESAGGGSTLQLLNAPQARGLFHKAIVQSGGGRDRLPPLRAAGEERSAESVGAAFAARNAAATPEDLRAIPAERVLGKLDLLSPEKDTYSGLSIDGRLVLGNPVEGFTARRQAPVPLIIGATDNELGAIPGPLRGVVARRTLEDAGLPREPVEALYGEDFNMRMPTDLTFVEPARALAGLAADAGQPVWLYSFAYVAEAKRGEWSGAPHASDVGYAFDTLDRLKGDFSAADQSMADRIAETWVAFARYGTPPADVAWPAYDRRQDRLLRFGPAGPIASPVPDAARLDALGDLRRRHDNP